MKGWLLDTNIIASLTSPNAAPAVKAWVAAQDERTLYLSIITLAEYDQAIHQLPKDDPRRAPYAANCDAIEARSGTRILPVSKRVPHPGSRLISSTNQFSMDRRPGRRVLGAAKPLNKRRYVRRMTARFVGSGHGTRLTRRSPDTRS